MDIHSVKDTYAYYFKRLFTKLLNASRADFQNIGLTREQYIMMYFINEEPGITQAKLADTLYKDRNVVGRDIDSLEKIKYVQRVRGEKDRRAFALYLTETGKKCVSENWHLIVKTENIVSEKLTEEECEQLMKLLRKLLL